MNEIKLYIGAKIIQAVEMDAYTFLKYVKREDVPEDMEQTPGYKVIYPDGYVSWSPKETFETAYREITPDEIALMEDR